MVRNLRPRQAAAALGISVSSFWVWAKTDPDFPPLIHLERLPRACASYGRILIRFYLPDAIPEYASSEYSCPGSGMAVPFSLTVRRRAPLLNLPPRAG